MFLDARTRNNLELTASISGAGAKTTLYGVLDRTKTPMGGRLLKTWLTRPLLNPIEISKRHDAVQELCGKKTVLNKIREVLAVIGDVERLISRVCLEQANPREISALADSLRHSWELREASENLEGDLLKSCIEGIGDLRGMAENINTAIADEPPLVISEGGIFRDGYNIELDDLRGISSSGKNWIAEHQAQERQRTGISNLKIKYNNVFWIFHRDFQFKHPECPPIIICASRLWSMPRDTSLPNSRNTRPRFLAHPKKYRNLKKDSLSS